MDSVFQLSNGDRVGYLLNLMHSFGCSYICLWAYSPDISLLYCEDGHFQGGVASSSLGTSLTLKLFEDYKNSFFGVGKQSLVPGLAFKNRNPYLELQELDLQRLASIDVQRQFYTEARIKMAVFLGCSRGEIELGMSYIPQNLETKMQSIFPQELSGLQASQPMETPRLIIEQNHPSSSSSQSMDSPEYPQFFYFPSNNTTTTTTIKQPSANTQTIQMPTGPNQLDNIIPFPTPESTDAALTRAYLAILSTQSSTNGAQQSSKAPYVECQVSHHRPSAFKSYNHGSRLGVSGVKRPNNLRRQNLLKRAIVYYRELNYRRVQEHANSVLGSRPTSTQLHHMISERRRREKINESFQALRSLLPQGTKKDKASVLRTTKEYLSSLKNQLLDLNTRNKILEEQLKTKKITTIIQDDNNNASSNERLHVRITPVQESSSRGRLVDVSVRSRRGIPVADLIMKLLELLKQTKEVSIVSIDAHACEEVVEDGHNSMDAVVIRLQIEGDDWDESAFKEAVTRILSDFG
ncbi:hypothetical protein vseg_000703 [Gypsophila vaccaria]